MDKKKPIHEIRLGKVRAAIWENGTESDHVRYSVTFSRLQHSDNAEYVIIYRGAVAANYPLMLEAMPIHMVPGEIIYATSVGASAAHPTHIHISGAKTTRTQTPKA